MNGSEMFGEVQLGYDAMYQGVYSSGEPVKFNDYVKSCCKDPLDQTEFWSIASDLAEDVGADSFDLVQRENPLIVELVNYKGEYEGVELWSKAKSFCKGKFEKKFEYSNIK